MKFFPLPTLRALLLTAATLTCAHSWAAASDMMNPLASKKTAANPVDEPTAGKSIQELLTETKNELAKFNADLASANAASANAASASDRPSDDEINDKRNRLDNIIRAYEEQLSNEQRIADVQKRRELFKQEQSLTLDPKKGPPYAITYADRLHRSLEKAMTNVAARELQLEFLRQNFQRQIDEVKNAEAAKRQSDETIENNPDSPGKAAFLRAANLANIKLHEAQANLALIGSTIRFNDEFLAFERDQLALAESYVKQLNGQIVFTKEDSDRLQERYTTEQEKYSKEAVVVAKYVKQVRRDYDAKQQELATEKAKPRPADDAAGNQRLEELERQVNDLAYEMEKSERLVEMVQHSIDIAGVKRKLWDARYRVFNQRSPETLAAAQTVMHEANLWVTGRSNLLISKINHEFVNERTLANQLKGKIDYGEIRERVVYDAERVAWLAQKLDKEIDRDISTDNLLNSLKDSSDSFLYNLTNSWNWELFAVEDTVQIDGKTVTGRRGVTVGKIVKAMIFILLGALGVILLARMGERHAINKYQWRPESARLARRWIHALGFIALTISALIWVNIPLSIFAFMGGALAIGFGFGVQNLLKNLMSGVMLLLERPLRIGDLVELDGIQGNVVNIGIRSITIRGGNGVETLVPNSLFIEQKLTNWTYSSPLVRFQFAIGVDYNSPVETVRQLLQQALNDDPGILRYPAPEVSFDDFGADSLVFNVYYWLELGGDISNRRIASELRFRIFKQFAESKINIAYPQRDVHLHASSPIKFQLHTPETEDQTG